MATRVNRAPNPALAVSAAGWTGPSGWARSTSVGGSLPRATGFEGTTAGDVLTPRAAVTAGQSYRWAVSVRATGGALSANLLVNYYAALSGGAFVANSGPTVPLNLASGATARFVLGPYTVPAGAVSGYLKLNDLDAGCEVTAYQVELSSTYNGTYFDGATAGASWDGTVGESTSTIREIRETLAITDGFSRSVTAAGPVATDRVNVAEGFSIASTAMLVEDVGIRDGFLIAALDYSEQLGRNRVSAFTFAPTVTRVRVSRRPVSGGVWTTVRGGEVAAASGRMVRPVDDYEWPSGVDVDYRIDGLSSPVGSPDVVVQRATVRRSAAVDGLWIKFITQPSLNRRLDYMGRSEISRPSRAAIYQVQGRSDPVVVSDVHGSRRLTIRVKTETAAETAALDHALAQGLPCYLHAPATLNLPSMYAVVGDYSFEPPALKSQRNVWQIQLTEVAAPPPTITSPYATWASLLARYPSWEDLMAAVPTWLQTAD